ncbi:hypothetical protein STEG23_004480 [Scotinomys teguina]
MQREDIILEWIFLPNKQSKKLKTYVEKISDLILKGKLRLRQLAGIDPAEIVIPLTKKDIEKLWAESEPWQRACSNFLGEINSKYPKSDRIELIKRADWILPQIVRETPISGVSTFYTDANKQGKAGYKSEDLSKVVQSPYNSVQKSELYAILLVLMDFSEPLNIVTDSQYAERVVLHIETAEFIPDESELTSLFIQLQDIIRNRKHPLYITHIRSHTGLPGPLAQGNDEIDKLLIGNVLEASEFHKKHHVNSKGLKRDFSITWQQAKEIVRKCPTCSFFNQTPLPAGCNPKGTQRNDIWQMDVFHFAEFGKLKYVHHTIDTYSGFQWATALSSEKADSVITHLLEVMAIMGIPAQIKIDNAPAYVSGKMKQFFAYYNIKHITGKRIILNQYGAIITGNVCLPASCLTVGLFICFYLLQEDASQMMDEQGTDLNIYKLELHKFQSVFEFGSYCCDKHCDQRFLQGCVKIQRVGLILRVLNTNINGQRKTAFAITAVKGVGRRFAHVVLRKADIDLTKRAGELTEDEAEHVITIMQNPGQYKNPDWFLNTKKDRKYSQVLANCLDNELHEDLESLKRIRAHRGLRHFWGLPV